jgi:hypothetical protein
MDWNVRDQSDQSDWPVLIVRGGRDQGGTDDGSTADEETDDSNHSELSSVGDTWPHQQQFRSQQFRRLMGIMFKIGILIGRCLILGKLVANRV